jgi:ribosomal protein S18 acetylase RimI-like enzyme
MVSQISIRQAVVGDAAQIASIHCASWRDAYADVLDPTFLAGPVEDDRRCLWSARLATPPEQQVVLVADAGAKPIAFVCLYRAHDAQWGSLIDNLHVLPHLRGARIGERLIRAVASFISPSTQPTGLHLWVFKANEAGLRFYQRLGGQVVEQAVSELPAANGAPVLRVFWPDCSALR